MSPNNKKQQNQPPADTRNEAGKGVTRRWPIQQVLILALGVVLGFALSNALPGDTAGEVANPSTPTTAPGPSGSGDSAGSDGPAGSGAKGQVDAYGRAPGDPHYGHNHP